MKIIYCHHANRKIRKEKTEKDDITNLGKKDAKITSKLLEKLPNLKAIYRGESKRHQKTAEILNKTLNLPIYIDKRLNEYQSELNENWIELQKRTIDFCNEIFSKYDNDDTILCITSGVNISGFICWNFDLKPSDSTPFIQVPNCCPLCFTKEK